MIDTRSSADILLGHAYERMKHMLRAKLKPYDYEFYRFNNELVRAQGIITLPLKLKDNKHFATHQVNFLMINYWSPYNTIFGRPSQLIFGMIVSQPHLKEKFLSPLIAN